jgi:hypothetical protein
MSHWLLSIYIAWNVKAASWVNRMKGSSPKTGLHRLRKNSVLYQGTTLVGPQIDRKYVGALAPGYVFSSRPRVFRSLSSTEPQLTPQQNCHPDRRVMEIRGSVGTCGFFPSRNHANLSHPSPLVIPTVVEGSAVRPAALSNPSWEATRRNHPLPMKSYPQPAFAMSGRSTRLSNEINPKESNNHSNNSGPSRGAKRVELSLTQWGHRTKRKFMYAKAGSGGMD